MKSNRPVRYKLKRMIEIVQRQGEKARGQLETKAQYFYLLPIKLMHLVSHLISLWDLMTTSKQIRWSPNCCITQLEVMDLQPITIFKSLPVLPARLGCIFSRSPQHIWRWLSYQIRRWQLLSIWCFHHHCRPLTEIHTSFVIGRSDFDGRCYGCCCCCCW